MQKVAGNLPFQKGEPGHRQCSYGLHFWNRRSDERHRWETPIDLRLNLRRKQRKRWPRPSVKKGRRVRRREGVTYHELNQQKNEAVFFDVEKGITGKMSQASAQANLLGRPGERRGGGGWGAIQLRHPQISSATWSRSKIRSTSCLKARFLAALARKSRCGGRRDLKMGRFYDKIHWNGWC